MSEVQKHYTIKGTTAHCNHCKWHKEYANATLAKRMGGNHVVKTHPDKCPPAGHTIKAKPSSEIRAEEPAKRPYTKRRQPAQLGVNFCPCCGTNLRAVSVALSV